VKETWAAKPGYCFGSSECCWLFYYFLFAGSEPLLNKEIKCENQSEKENCDPESDEPSFEWSGEGIEELFNFW
jgi:hypothetical protein